MRKLVIVVLFTFVSGTLCFPQLGGLLNKAKSGKGSDVVYSIEIVERYSSYYKTLSNSDLKENEMAINREQAAKLLDPDSAKQIHDYAQKNLKKYSNDMYSVEEFISSYSKFNENFDNNVLKPVNEKLKQPYTEQFEIKVSEAQWLINSKSAVSNAKKIYSGAVNLDEVVKNIEVKRNEYTQSLIKSKSLICADQLNYFQQIRFSDSGSETSCVRGKDKFDTDVTDNGVFMYYAGDLPLNLCRIYVDGKEAYSLSKDDISDSNNGNMKPDGGWYKILLLPGLKVSTYRSVARLRNLTKDYGLKKGSEVTIKYQGVSYMFKYNLSGYTGTIEEYLSQVKGNQLKTVKSTDTKYKNAVVEKEAIEAYNTFKTINPQYNEGDVKRVSVSGNNWTIYKTKLGLLDYQQTDAYFILKGKDGNCYEDYRKIRKVYDPKAKTYGPIKVVGGVDKREISCDLIK